MNNIYYLFFYLVVNYVKWLRPNYKEYSFSSIIFMSMCMGFNFITLMGVIEIYTKYRIGDYLLYFIMALLFGINYYFIYHKKKRI